MELSISIKQKHKSYVELIQFTDTHIFADQNQTFDGIDTAKSLKQVMDHARASDWPPDAILMTGDLVHYPSPLAYERLAGILKTIQQPIFCIPGNHDDPHVMLQVFSKENINTVKLIIFSDWIIFMLDTFLPGTHAGHLSKDELSFLDQQLATYKTRHALICLHHPPVSIGSPWMDKMGLQNPADLFSIIDKHAQVRAMLWGHIHQEFFSMYKNVQLMATPSTCVQFTPKTNEYIKDNQTAGYRCLKLRASGKINTEIIRIGHS